MALQTAFGLGQRGFFTPYRYADAARPASGYPEISAALLSHEPRFSSVLEAIDALAPDLAAIGGEPPPAPRWSQGWFPTLDASAAYALLRNAPPARVIEVGSGHSTRFIARALADAQREADILCIDPQPRAALTSLPVRWERRVLDEKHVAQFDTLEPGDVAFFDSSHILWPGLDVDLMLNRILPRLRPGVRVHIHDIFLPDPYPESWAWRGYTEQNALAGWIIGGAYRPLFASRYAATRMNALGRPALIALPRHPASIDTSLWLERC